MSSEHYRSARNALVDIKMYEGHVLMRRADGEWEWVHRDKLCSTTWKWYTAMFTMFFVIAFMLIGLRAVTAHDPDHSELNEWYSRLQSKGKAMCCDGSDFGSGTAAHLEPQDWQTQDKPNSHYKVFLEGEWRDVPDTALVDVPNKDGRALVWFYTTWVSATVATPTIRCFMPGAMG
jgi:hypothetical protein